MAASALSIDGAALDGAGRLLFLLVLILVVLVALVSTSRDPEATLTVVQGSILTSKVVALGVALDVVAAALAQGTGACGEGRRDLGIGSDPVGERILTVLDDSLGGLVAIVGGTGLARGDRGVVDKLEQVLAVAGNDGQLLAVLAQGVELVGVGSLELLARDVGELSLGDEGLGLGTDELLLEDDNLGRVGLFVLELGDLIGDLLLACT